MVFEQNESVNDDSVYTIYEIEDAEGFQAADELRLGDIYVGAVESNMVAVPCEQDERASDLLESRGYKHTKISGIDEPQLLSGFKDDLSDFSYSLASASSDD